MFSAAYKRYVLGSLTFVFALNLVDRSLISLLLQPIKLELHLSDTQLGFLTGIAFGMFYAVLGLPIARMADRGNRSTITSIAIGLWGLTVMSCVFVTNFAQLVLARVAAAVGESGCMPPTYSLVGDYYPAPAERSRAMAIYWLANPISTLVSFVAGGWLSRSWGWRGTLFAMGIPALLAAVLVKATVAEPRTQLGNNTAPIRPTPPLLTILRLLWRQKSSRHLIFALILLWTMGLGMASWYATFMMRSHGMSTEQVGLWLGAALGPADFAGTLLGGCVAGWWFAHNERRQMQLSAIMIGAMVPCYIVFLLLPNIHYALAALAVVVLVSGIFVAPTFAIMQRLVVDEMRATTLAIIMLLANLIGMGLGPQIVGIVSDLLMPRFGSDSLRYAMLMMSFVALWSAIHFWRVARTVREDLAAVTRNAESTELPVSAHALTVKPLPSP
jgi:MFS family permease